MTKNHSIRDVIITLMPTTICDIVNNDKKHIRKSTAPPTQLPFKAYIYCASNRRKGICDTYIPKTPIFTKNGVIKDNIGREDGLPWSLCNGKVIGEFICNKIVKNDDKSYSWEVSNLIIYQSPKKISDFCRIDSVGVTTCKYREQSYYGFTDTGYIKNGFYCSDTDDWCNKCKREVLDKAPTNWMYAEPMITLGNPQFIPSRWCMDCINLNRDDVGSEYCTKVTGNTWYGHPICHSYTQKMEEHNEDSNAI